ncbi:hypothetical protein BROUX41_002285 [Berkeleyomyces rouxiae]|uniref:uncharacterized protein n=1 Tax=Berkeleyomyces rouxiae TaxID=2035830 RepID=UPI003B79ECC0
MIDLGLAADTGSQVLAEVVEVSLDEVLAALRSTVLSKDATTTQKSYLPKKTGVPTLDALALRNFQETQAAQLSVNGRSMPFIHALLDHLVSPPQNKTVTLVDLESRFDATRLTSSRADIAHIHVFRMPPGPTLASSTAALITAQVRDVVAKAQQWMIYGSHQSASREWWGTIVIGAPGGQVWTGWRGWLRVSAEEIPGFVPGISVREAMVERGRREMVVDGVQWVVKCPWGRFAFRGRLMKDEEDGQHHHDSAGDGTLDM